MRVNIYQRPGDGWDRVPIGYLELRGERVVASDPANPTLAEIAATPIWPKRGTDNIYNPVTDPRGFLENLYLEYNGLCLSAGKPIDNDQGVNLSDAMPPKQYAASEDVQKLVREHGVSAVLGLLATAIKDKEQPLEGTAAFAKKSPLPGTAEFARMPLRELLQLKRLLGAERERYSLFGRNPVR
jgi:hypothetical protein